MTKDDKLLIVENNPSVAQVISVVAKRNGYQAHTAASLAELKAASLKPEAFSLACVDYNLPDASQGQAIDYVVELGIASFVVTDSLDEKIRTDILSKQVIDYIPKETIQSYDYIGKLLSRLRKNKSTRILVVDDSKSARSYIKRLLIRHHFLISEAENGQQALERLNEFDDIKLVITDHEMPIMGGIELVSEIRRKISSDKLAIIGVSGGSQKSLSARFLKNGANDFLAKTFGQEEFYTRIFKNLDYLEEIAKAQHAASHDFLTDLTNRRYFFEQIPTLLINNKKQNLPSCVAILDLDKFKSVNDSYGHDIGDLVLKEVAHRLRSHFPEDNIIKARFGGEEFCLFLSNVCQAEAAGRLEFFRHHLETFSFDLGQHKLEVTTSIGLSRVENNDIDNAISLADQALYQAKSNGRNLLQEA